MIIESNENKALMELEKHTIMMLFPLGNMYLVITFLPLDMGTQLFA